MDESGKEARNLRRIGGWENIKSRKGGSHMIECQIMIVMNFTRLLHP